MTRAKVREIAPPDEIVPQAQPVDAYVRPPDPAPSPLHDLAKGLAALDSGLSGFLSKRQGKQNEADRLRGEAAFNRNNQTGWAEAVRTGAVPANSSPLFMEGYKQQQGNLMGLQLVDKFRDAWVHWDGRNSDDPDAFQKFLQGFLKENITTDDPDILRGLNPHVERLIEGGYKQFSEERANQAYNNSIKTDAAVSGETIDMAQRDGLDREEGTDYNGIWDTLVGIRQQALERGTRAEDYDKELVAAIIAKSIEHEEPELLNLLDKTLPGQDHPLSSFPAFRDQKQAAIDKLEVMARQRVTDLHRAEKEADKKAENAIWVGVARAIAEDPTKPIPEEVIKNLEKYDPMARKKLVEMRKTLMDGSVEEDPRALLELYEDIRNGATEKDINQAVLDGVIRTPQTLNAALDRLDKYNKAKEGGDSILKSASAERTRRIIKSRTERSELDQMIDVFGVRGLTDEGLQATQDFEWMLLEWQEANPNATLMEREKAIKDITELVMSRLTAETGAEYISEADRQARDRGDRLGEPRTDSQEGAQRNSGDPATHQPPAPDASPESATSRQDNRLPEPDPERFFRQKATDLEKGAEDLRTQEEAARAEEERARAEADAATAREQEAVEPWAGDAPPKLEDLSEDQRKSITDEASKLGIGADEYTRLVWKKMQELVHKATKPDDEESPGVDPTTTESIIPEADKISLERTIEDGLTQQPQAAPQAGRSDPTIQKEAPVVQARGGILDLIGHSEGTDKGRGYNETLAYGKFTGGDVELTSMTLDQIDALQGQMLRHPENKWNSSAVGRYQIVRTTLRRLREKLGLSGSERFTPQLQDRLAYELLKGRGYEKWKAGKMTDAAFLTSLSKEWASLPSAAGGGFYSGQRATVKPSDVLAALGGTGSFAPTPAAYANIPKGEIDQFVEWNSDPVANSEENLKTVNKDLQKVVKLAMEISPIKFVVASGKRSKELQAKAVEWGWSKTMNSDHLHDNAVDLWALDDKGAIIFDKTMQDAIVRAMTQAAKELGIGITAGADWRNPDRPHFGLKG